MLQSIKLSSLAKPAFCLTVLLSFYILFTPSGGPALFAHADKVIHFTLFALLAATWRWAFGWSYLIIRYLLAYAVISEVIQHFLPTRSASAWDLLADALGVVVVGIVTRPKTKAT